MADAGSGRSGGPAARRIGRTGTSPDRPYGPASSAHECGGTRRTVCPGARRTAPVQSSGCACGAARTCQRTHEATCYTTPLSPVPFAANDALCVTGARAPLRPDRDLLDHQDPVSYTHLRAHETPEHLVCR